MNRKTSRRVTAAREWRLDHHPRQAGAPCPDRTGDLRRDARPGTARAHPRGADRRLRQAGHDARKQVRLLAAGPRLAGGRGVDRLSAGGLLQAWDELRPASWASWASWAER